MADFQACAPGPGHVVPRVRHRRAPEVELAHVHHRLLAELDNAETEVSVEVAERGVRLEEAGGPPPRTAEGEEVTRCPGLLRPLGERSPAATATPHRTW